MKNDLFLFAVILGTIAMIAPGYGLKCYNFGSTNTTLLSNDSSTWPVEECAPGLNKCVVYEYDGFAVHDGKSIYVGTGSQRKCTRDSLDIYCQYISTVSADIIESSSKGKVRGDVKNCHVCQTDLCNDFRVKT